MCCRARAEHADAASFSLICNGEWEEVRTISWGMLSHFPQVETTHERKLIAYQTGGEVVKDCYGI